MNKNILWLPSWYPTPLSPFDGDFIQRHARAVSLLNNITVVFIKKDEKAIITKNIKTDIFKNGNLTEIITYYHPLKTGFKLLDKIISITKYKILYRSIINKYISTHGVPDLAHVHVALKAGQQALWIKRKYNIPFVITEHWSGFFSENKNGIHSLNLLQKNVLKKVFGKADKLTVVSKILGKEIINFLGDIDYEVIPNCVDTSIFNPGEKIINKVTEFIHISTLNFEKNIPCIIEAFQILKQNSIPFHLTIYGPENKELQILIQEKGLNNTISLKKEVPQPLLAEDLKKTDALILYSRYETFGCVVIEANACGVPAILSDLPVFREYIIENKTGIFAKSNDSLSLSAALQKFIEMRNTFSATEIASYTKNKFSYTIIAQQFDKIYKSIK